MLLMKKRYFDAIRAGRKTTTLRFWSRRQVRPDSAHTIPGLGRVHISRVDVVRPNDLTDADAADDGFESVESLQGALAEVYPPALREGRQLYQIHFYLLA